MNKKIEFLTLARITSRIFHMDSLTWGQKYDLIFSPEISQTIHELVHLDYYDPDMDYEDDVRAFVDVVAEKRSEIGDA